LLPSESITVASFNKRKRILAFSQIFLSLVFDFWRESRLSKKYGSEEARRRMSSAHRKRAVKFRETALNLGGVLIKLGQFLGARVDVMPREYIEELHRLHDEVPPVPFEEAKKVIEAEFGRPLSEVFPEFDRRAVAAASLAQVHLAKLPSGEKVAVKVQRPNIQELANIDLAIFSYLVEGVDRFTSWGRQADLSGLVSEFTRTFGDELDFYREGYYAERFRQNFSEHPFVYIPKVYWAYTTDKVVTLEHVEGIKIGDYEALEKAGFDRSEIANLVVQSYLKQVLEDGFFHADPHPGNLFVLPGPKISFVDFGMVGEIREAIKDEIKEIFIGIAQRDIDQIIRALNKLGIIRPGANLEPIKRAIGWLYDKYATFGLHRISYEDLEEIQEDIRVIIYEQPITIPAEYAFLGRAASTMIGLVTGLDPDFDFVRAIKPYVRKVIGFGAQSWGDILVKEARQLGTTLLNLPRRMEKTLAKVEKGELRVKLDSASVTGSIDTLSRTRLSTSLSIVAGALIIGGVILYLSKLFFEAYLLFAISGVFVLASLSSVREKRKHFF
jgi:predicted unusual protein kinase regulating ubiquinone biosynthesis (AarF/ABC1/UbiB family)